LRAMAAPSQWTVAQVAEWVRSIGLPEAAQSFAEHEVEGAALLDLTTAELKDELGVSKFGHVKKLSKALEELRALEKGAALAEVNAATAAMVSSAWFYCIACARS
jgi:hypothetical protein